MIFVRSNGNRELIGRSLFVEEINEPISHSAFSIKLRFTSSEVFPKFYAYLFRSSLIRQVLSNQGNGTNISNLNQGILSNLQVPLPPLEEQRRIAAILSAYDDLIENNTRRIGILEEMARRIYEEWFVRFRFPGHEHVPLVESELGLIPQGWEVGTVQSVVELKSGFAFKTSAFVENGKYQLVTIKNVQDGSFIPECTSRLEILPPNLPNYCHLQEGDVLLSLTGNIGRVCVVYGKDYVLNQRVAKLAPTKPQHRAFAYCTFKNKDFRSRLENLANGVAQQNLSPVQTGQLKFALPNDALLDVFENSVGSMLDSIGSLNIRNANLRRTRDLLLPKLISGAIDVSEFPEPSEMTD